MKRGPVGRWRALVLAAALALAGAASAQISWGNIVSQSALDRLTLWDPLLRRSGGGGPAPATADASVSLPFRYDADVTRRVQGQIVAGARTTGRAEDVAVLEQALASGQVRRAYEGWMASLGVDHGRHEDALDPLATYLMVTWAIVNNTDLTPTMFRALRAQVGRTYAGVPDLLDTEDKRQEFGETLIYQTVLLAGAHEELLRMGAAERQGVARQFHQASLRRLGFDLRGVVLTEQGFGPR